jgi:hypothetical protein
VLNPFLLCVQCTLNPPQCRDEWISSLVADLDEGDSYEYVKHLTDVYRLHLFDAVMQYRAIFFDAAPSATVRAAAATGGRPTWLACMACQLEKGLESPALDKCRCGLRQGR